MGSHSPNLAYLVIREGSKWTDVFRLVPGLTVTVGRAATNQVVVKDERASRQHAEIFLTEGNWTLRDLDSRNGTTLDGEPVKGDHQLAPGDLIRIAHCQMQFVHDLSEAFGDHPPDESGSDVDLAGGGSTGGHGSDSPLVLEPTVITHRRGQTRYLKPQSDDTAIPKVGLAATLLCRIAFELAQQKDVAAVSNIALNGLFEGTKVDAGAVLLAPRGQSGVDELEQLEVVATRFDVETRYHRVSPFLATTALRDGEAVLARNIGDDSMLGTADSKGEIHSTSAVCAPIRSGRSVIGLIHTYSTVEDRQPDPDDLEFTLAVADNVALALTNLSKQAELAEYLSQSKSEIMQLRKRLGVESELVGSSRVMHDVQQEIARASRSRATVLIRGESGVGKELVARAVHYSGPRRKGPFVCLNCAALSETLLESELFGHERGAFTGATDRKIGKFEAAHQGTLMLDEIGEMSPTIQAKFLRVLEGHPFERVGGSQQIKVDVRVIAATNRDLEKAVKKKEFRGDLYFRLRVLEIMIAPLRKRREDILEMAMHFLDRFNSETGRRLRGFSPDALEQLQRYRWPGNVRELKNMIERAVVLCQGDYIEVDDLALSTLSTPGESAEIQLPGTGGFEPMSLVDMERQHIRQTLESTGWNKSRAAVILGIERSTLDRKIRRYELKKP